MAEASTTNPITRIWVARILFIVLSLCIIFADLLPLNTMPRSWAPPDLMLALTFVWVVRRPSFVPITLIAAIFLLADLIYLRPPGLWAAIVVVGSELLRSRAAALRNVTLPLEWATVAGVMLGAMAVNRVVLAGTVVDQAPLVLTLIQLVLTILVYPLVVAASHYLFGVRKSAPGQVDALGHRL